MQSAEIMLPEAGPLPGKRLYSRVGKRLFDLFVVVSVAPLALVLIAITYVFARRDGGPAFFGHKRVGKNGKTFKCWKVRSMVIDSEARLAKHLAENPEAAAEWERDRKLTNDPRITRFGDFIRRTSLDELPQLYNVLKGEMSIVGPRPVVEAELEKYGAKVPWYLSQKPGITGLWQVSGRNDVTYAERVDMDVTYAQNVGLIFDIEIVGKTAVAVLARTGK